MTTTQVWHNALFVAGFEYKIENKMKGFHDFFFNRLRKEKTVDSSDVFHLTKFDLRQTVHEPVTFEQGKAVEPNIYKSFQCRIS